MKAPRRDWITPQEAADLLGCSAVYVRRLATQGRLVAELASGIWLLYRPDVLAHKRRPALKSGPK